MKLHLAASPQTHFFTAIEPGQVKVDQQPYSQPLILMPEKIVENWTAHTFETLTESDFSTLAGLGCQIVLLGTGNRLRFPSGSLLRPIAEAGIGLEVMDLAAACRTYNILAEEGRSVAAALLFD